MSEREALTSNEDKIDKNWPVAELLSNETSIDSASFCNIYGSSSDPPSDVHGSHAGHNSSIGNVAILMAPPQDDMVGSRSSSSDDSFLSFQRAPSPQAFFVADLNEEGMSSSYQACPLARLYSGLSNALNKYPADLYSPSFSRSSGEDVMPPELAAAMVPVAGLGKAAHALRRGARSVPPRTSCVGAAFPTKGPLKSALVMIGDRGHGLEALKRRARSTPCKSVAHC